jgi:UDP-GlcNAc:undecaprenyl-phosphate GlcNAc-1-phosphate transferase
MALYTTHFLNAFLLAVVFILLLERVAPRFGLIDVPDARKAHGRSVPLVGGLAIFGGFIVSSLLVPLEYQPPWPLVVGLALLVGVGTLDDLYDLSPVTRLCVQVAAASVMVVPDWLVTTNLGHLFGPSEFALGMFALPFTLFFITGLVNAFNMLDGLDGLTGGTAVCSFAGLGLAAAMRQEPDLLLCLMLLISATLGFLIFNFRHPWCRQARVFMGDAGSLMLGGAVAFFALKVATHETNPLALGTLLWLFAVPLLDTLSLIVRRVLAGRSPFRGDRQHLHHLLLDCGLTPRQATCAMLAASIGLGLFGLLGLHFEWPDALMTWGLVVPAVAHTSFVLSRTGAAEVRASLQPPTRAVELVPPPEGQSA